jgi:hypothetical protein
MRIGASFHRIGPVLTGLSSVYIAVQIARIARSVERTHDEMTEFLQTTNARLQRAEQQLDRRRKRWVPW